MKLNTIIVLLFFIVLLINKNQGKEIKQHVNGLNFQLELYSNEYRYYNFCNALYDYRKPYGYVKVHSEHEIRDVLLYAKSIGKTLSVRSGGHSFTSLSILNDTINLDLSGMKSIVVDPQEKTVLVQSGVLLGSLYKELLKYGLISTGGTGTGIGMGIALGGGSGYLGPKYGYFIDSIIEHTVVLANGHIVKANKHNEYSDLHWALLGSGIGGFGVVTDYKIKLYPSQPIYYHNQITIEQDGLVDATLILNEYVDSLTDIEQCNMHFYIFGYFSNGINMFSIDLFYMDIDPITQGNIHYYKLLKLVKQKIPNAKQNMNTKIEKSFMELLDMSPEVGTGPSFSFGFCRFSLLNNQTANTLLSIFNEYNKIRDQVSKIEKESYCSVQINYNGGKQIYEEPGQFGKRATSFIHRGYKNKWAIGLYCRYLDENNHKYFNSFRNYLNENLDSFSKRIYPNIQEIVDDWQTRNYGDNYPILQDIKLKYDPTNYFNYPQSIELPTTKKI